MSAGGSEIFDADLAWDVREGYRRMLQDRVPDDEATRRTIADWSDLGPDEVPVFWLALAAAQARVGRLEPDVRDRALAVIDSGADLLRWQRQDPGLVAGRVAVLARLREELTGPQPPRRAIRRPYRYVTDLRQGDVLVWRASTGIVVPLRVMQVSDERQMSAPFLEQLAWDGPDVPAAGVLAELPRAARPARTEDGHQPEPVYAPFRPRRRDPDWSDLGFTACGSIPPRPGDDGDLVPGTSFLQWAGLPLHLEHAVTGRWPEDLTQSGAPEVQRHSDGRSTTGVEVSGDRGR